MFADASDWELHGSASPVCEACGAEPATVHVVRMEDGNITHTRLCQSCAEEAAEEQEQVSLVFALPADLAGLFGGFFLKASTQRADSTDGQRVCEVCGTTMDEVVETGLLGCPTCYEAFSDQVAASMGEDTEVYPGKVPLQRSAPGGLDTAREVARLQHMLRELVETERFEEAASVRDRLAELDRELSKG